MRELQEEALSELSEFTIPMEMSDTIAGTIKVFEDLSLPEGLRQFAFLALPSSLENLRQQAIETLNDGSMVSMFGATHHDADGKAVAEIEALGIGEEPSEQRVKYKMEEIEGFRRFELVKGYIHPAREFISSAFLSERHFYPIVRASPFVPASHEHIFALGLARLIQGDYVSAVHLLIPQVENSIRNVLKNLNTDSSRILSDMIQEDRSLDSLLTNYKAEMDRVFSPDVVLQIDLLFNGKPGPGLRLNSLTASSTPDTAITPTLSTRCGSSTNFASCPSFVSGPHTSPRQSKQTVSSQPDTTRDCSNGRFAYPPAAALLRMATFGPSHRTHWGMDEVVSEPTA
ncbi:hypothetical protein [Mesorhizobium sp. 1B3]|uniref:hypothetical protein n=1 Tax=Mesorhizobium sp. 1B3 TaxID=3243599 RepID=UPI003D961253